jgi:hypothetical protein
MNLHHIKVYEELSDMGHTGASVIPDTTADCCSCTAYFYEYSYANEYPFYDFPAD